MAHAKPHWVWISVDPILSSELWFRPSTKRLEFQHQEDQARGDECKRRRGGRSLPAASSHGIEPAEYLRDLLCLLPSWKAAEVLDLAPARWRENRRPNRRTGEPRRQRLPPRLARRSRPRRLPLVKPACSLQRTGPRALPRARRRRERDSSDRYVVRFGSAGIRGSLPGERRVQTERQCCPNRRIQDYRRPKQRDPRVRREPFGIEGDAHRFCVKDLSVGGCNSASQNDEASSSAAATRKRHGAGPPHRCKCRTWRC